MIRTTGLGWATPGAGPQQSEGPAVSESGASVWGCGGGGKLSDSRGCLWTPRVQGLP